jgi:hypothetical protein
MNSNAREQRPNSSPVQICCTRCDATFRRVEHLRRHERVHDAHKRFACSKCSKVFTRRYACRSFPSGSYIALGSSASLATSSTGTKPLIPPMAYNLPSIGLVQDAQDPEKDAPKLIPAHIVEREVCNVSTLKDEPTNGTSSDISSRVH